MGLFYNKPPRRFSHKFIYVDERRERLREMERKYKSGIGLSAENTGHEDSEPGIKQHFIIGFRQERRKEGIGYSNMQAMFVVVALMLFLVCCLYIL